MLSLCGFIIQVRIVLGTVKDFTKAVFRGRVSIYDVYCFIQGWARYLLMRSFLSCLVPGFIREQIKWRERKADPICKDQGVCMGCSCAYPQVIYCNKPCMLKCYPRMFSKYEWEELMES